MDTNPRSGLVPLPLTSFVGRTDELDLAQALLEDPNRRLLTLTGPGGIGKTRLAIEIANRLGADYPDGVTFVPLAAVPSPSMVLPTLGSALGLGEIETERAFDAITSALSRSRRLLVIDNLEHLPEAAPELTRLLSHCPNIKILATSRSLLRVEGEHALPVPPLALPSAESGSSADWANAPVVRLFIERASALDPARAWSPDDVRQVVTICGRLDGLPLAVELAATRIRHLSLAEIRERLDDRLPLLIGGSRDHPSRLQTMRAAIAWSYDLLSPADQRLFRRLAVFSGGCTLEAIEAVSAQLDSEPAMLPDQLAALIDASLLVRDIDSVNGVARYRMLETIRDYAREQLEQRDVLDATRRAHAVAFMQLAEHYEFADLLPTSANAIERLGIERANLGAALIWLDNAHDTERLLRLVAALGNFWTSTAAYREATYWHERALSKRDDRPDPNRAKIQVQLGMARLLQGDIAGATPQFTNGLAACRAFNEPYYAALALLGLATAAILQGDNALATTHLHACHESAASIADRRLAEIVLGMVSLNLGVVSRAAGNLDLAAEQISDMLHRARAADYLQGTLIAFGDLGDLARDRAEWDRALAFYREGLNLGKDQPLKRTIIEIIESVAIVAFRTGQPERSAMLAGAAEALRERTGLRYIQPESSGSLLLAVQGSLAALGEPAFVAAWETGRICSTGDAIAAALAVQVHAPTSSSSHLTLRETEVARLLVLGMTDPEIADTLFISVRTVENHVAHILAKLDVHTRTAAASAAIAAGIVPSSQTSS
jgi:non-specific serine/threonine protein kinase